MLSAPESTFALALVEGTAKEGRMLEVGVPFGFSMFSFTSGSEKAPSSTVTVGAAMPGMLAADGAE